MSGRTVCRLSALAFLILTAPLTLAATPEDAIRAVGGRTPGPRFFDGARIESGRVEPERTDAALLVGANFSCGTLLWRKLDWTNGARWWSSSIKPGEFEGSKGDVSDFSIHSNLNWHLLQVLRLRPYLMAGPAVHFVGADIPSNSALEGDIGGTYFGLDYGLGVATAWKGINVRGEVRREELEQLPNWNATLGIGWWPRSDAVILSVAQETPGATGASATPAPTRETPGATGAPTTSAPTTAPAAAAGTAGSEAAGAAAIGTAAAVVAVGTPPVAADSVATGATVAVVVAATPPSAADSLVTNATAADSAGASASSAAAPPAPVPTDRNERRLAAFHRYAELAGQPTGATQDADGVTYISESLATFASGSKLDTRAREGIRRLAVLLLVYPEVTVSIEGHADSRGSKAANQRVSQARAESVLQELLRLGVAATQIEARSVSDSRPVGDNATDSGRTANRRVSIIVRGGAQ